MSGGVGVGVDDELVDDELVEVELVEDELLEVDDSDDAVVLEGGLIVSVQETVDISFDVDDSLVELEVVESEPVEVELVVCWVVGGRREELVFCDDAEGPAVSVIEGPVTVTVPDLVAVTKVEELVLNAQEVVMLGAKVERVTVDSVPLSLGV